MPDMWPRTVCYYCHRKRVFDKLVGSVDDGRYHLPYCEDCLRAAPALASPPQYWQPDPAHVARVLGQTGAPHADTP